MRNLTSYSIAQNCTARELFAQKREVAAFLDELHPLLESDDFDINMDLILIRKKKQGDDWKFSTPYTLLDLEYNAEDVVNRLKELKVEEYAETNSMCVISLCKG